MDVQEGNAVVDLNFTGELDTVVDAIEDVVEGFRWVTVAVSASEARAAGGVEAH